jgi:hypothetical protein
MKQTYGVGGTLSSPLPGETAEQVEEQSEGVNLTLLLGSKAGRGKKSTAQAGVVGNVRTTQVWGRGLGTWGVGCLVSAFVCRRAELRNSIDAENEMFTSALIYSGVREPQT